MWRYIPLICFLTIITRCFAANILAIIPTPSYSHQIPFRPLWRELSLKGHNITLITTDPIKDPSLKNLTEIDVSYCYPILEKHKFVEIASDESKSFLEIGLSIRKASNECVNAIFSSPDGQNLIHNPDNHFDLLIVEAQLPAMMVFSWKYQIPFIGISSLDCSMQYHVTAGNPTHPLVNPDTNLPIENPWHMSFKERLTTFLFNNIFKLLVYFVTFKREHTMLKTYFSEDLPSMIDIQNNMSMLFIATSPIFQSVRPLMPNTITLGNGMHIAGPKPLPKDIKEFLNSARDGAIYFSLGTNIKSTLLNDTTKDEFLQAFVSLPFKVLWKIDHQFKKLPPNVKTGKWMPQQDILRHPNVKLFITQGGLQSLQESIYHNIPLIGIPFFGDQIMNVKRMVHLEYGLYLNRHNITKVSVTNTVLEVLNNPKYREKAQEYGDIFRDVDISNVDKAVWWTEYVIRHKGAKHFRNPVLDMPFWQSNMLDVVGLVLGVLLVMFYLIIKIFKLIVKGFKILFGKKKAVVHKGKKNK